MRNNSTINKILNVAASRAKDQMWLLHSLDHTRDLQAGDIRRRLIEHCLDPASLRREMEEHAEKTESPFEREVLAVLVAAGYAVIPQYTVGSLRIDLPVTDGKRALAAECDGERFHGPEKLIPDMEKQRLLERLGHTFHRIRGSAFYRHRDQAVRHLLSRIEDMGIQPEARTAVLEPAAVGIHEDIIRSAGNKMIEWGWQPRAELLTTARSLASKASLHSMHK